MRDSVRVHDCIKHEESKGQKEFEGWHDGLVVGSLKQPDKEQRESIDGRAIFISDTAQFFLTTERWSKKKYGSSWTDLVFNMQALTQEVLLAWSQEAEGFCGAT